MYARESPATAPIPMEGLLWGVAALFFGFGDVATTSFGLGLVEVVELGPVVAPYLERYGLPAIMAMKIAVFGFAYLCWRLLPSQYRVGVPLGLALLGVFITGWNLGVLYFTAVA